MKAEVVYKLFACLPSSWKRSIHWTAASYDNIKNIDAPRQRLSDIKVIMRALT